MRRALLLMGHHGEGLVARARPRRVHHRVRHVVVRERARHGER